MTIRYYSIEIENNNNFNLFNEVKATLYNNFICITVSYCYENKCADDVSHYSSFFILNYANNSDNSLDLITHLYETNEYIDNDFCLNLSEKLVINNNVFGYVYKGIQIIDYQKNIYLKNNDIIIEKNSIILKDECITLSFDNSENFEAMNYTIEYEYILNEPDYQYSNNYIDDIDYSHGNIIPMCDKLFGNDLRVITNEPVNIAWYG